MFEEYSDEQEVVRTVSDIKKLANVNWWVGFASGGAMIIGVLVLIAAVGLYFNI